VKKKNDKYNPTVPAFEKDKKIDETEKSNESQVVQQESLTRLLVKKGIFTKKEFLEMLRLVKREIYGYVL
jgi:hypothetical protein